MLIFLLFSVVILLVFHNFYWKRRNLPSGPIPLPLVGNLHTISRYEPGYEAFDMWRKKYGPVYTFWMGSVPFVMICEYEKLKETFIKDGDTYSGKFNLEEVTKVYRGGQFGIIDADGDRWKEHRKFVIHQLRNFGVGKDLMQDKILLEVEAVTKILTASDGAEVEIQEVWDEAVGNVINQFLFGYRFDESNINEFRELKSLLSSQLRDFSSPLAFFIMSYSWTKHFPVGKVLWEKMRFYRDAFFTFFKRQIEEHRKEIDFDLEESRDYVEAYLKEQRKREQSGDFESFCDNQLVNVCVDLWFAGMETTANTLTWAISYLLNNPGVQEKLHEELDREIGFERDILTCDKSKLVYHNAFINETQRLANLLPLNIFHVLNKPVEMNGFNLPIGTGVCAQVSSVLYDENVFPEPYKFDPMRLIDENGALKKVDELVPFSVGKRQCLGKGLAKTELFLFSANLFNRFKVTAGEKGNPSLQKRFGVAMQPPFYTCRFERRY